MPLSVPHGGKLVDRFLRDGAQKEALTEAKNLKKVPLSDVAVSDLELIATGVLSPLTGFMHQEDYESVIKDIRLKNGLIWSIPVTLPVTKERAADFRISEKLALVEPSGKILGMMKLEEKYPAQKEREAKEVYKTTDEAHPGVARIFKQGDVLLAGEVWMIDMPSDVTFPEYRRTPVQTRKLFEELGWKSVVAFQTRNPIHRAHEYIQKCALEIVDGLFLNPLVGETKSDDVPAAVRMESYEALLRDYYPKNRTVLSVFPAAMRYAGPREAIWHAIARKNYGCTHIIIGRDHAGVGKYYGTYDAQKIFENFKNGELGITNLNFEHSFYCKKCGQVLTSKTCPHDSSNHLVLSGTQVREMLSRGEAPPPEFSRPEVVQVLIKAMKKPAA
jgi:sulfate adenylyltransferase